MKRVFILGFLLASSATGLIHAQGGGDSSQKCSIQLFEANPAQVSGGGSTILNWVTSNCTNVTIMGGNLSGYRPVTGNLTTEALAGTTTFTLTAASPSSSASRSITVTVQQPSSVTTAPVQAPPPAATTTTTTSTTPVPPTTPPEVAATPPPAATTTTTTSTTAPVVPSPAAPATSTTTTTTNNTTTVVPVYDADGRRHPINVNRLRFGAFIAPNISWMKPTAATDDGHAFNTESDGSKIGFTYGLMADYFFATNYGIITGISINSTGGKIQATAINAAAAPSKVVKAEFDYRLQYVDIPLALKLRTDDINGFRFFGQLGVSLGFNISKKADYKVSYYDKQSALRDTSGTKIKLTGAVTNIAPVMLQMNIGVGAEYPFNNKLTAYLGVFFNNGFTPDATNPEKFDSQKLGYGDATFKDANTRLNNFALRLGLFF